jgi:hypothetical protein
VPTQDDHAVSADLVGFTDPEADEVAHWQRLEREAANLCDPLARMIGHKNITFPLGLSGGQLTRELSSAYDNRLSLSVALITGRRSQNERLARLIVCDGLGMRMPEWQRRKVTPEEDLRALREECRNAGIAGQAILDAAGRRARGGSR